MTLFSGYSEMISRTSDMKYNSSWLCKFNGKIIPTLTNATYAFMGHFCLQWMLYKVLWTRASTIILAILSVQRTRTFYSLLYHESRSYACSACLFSIATAVVITCLEWTGVQYKNVPDSDVYLEIFQSILNNKRSKQLYTTFFYQDRNESMTKYPCMTEVFNEISFAVLENQVIF